MDYDPIRFYDDLVSHGLIIPSGVQGIFARGAVFEHVLQRFNDMVSESAKDDGAVNYTFPPVVNRKIIEKVDYLNSFPHLCGTVCGFHGNETQAREMAQRAREGRDWDDMLEQTDMVLGPAVCHPLYPTLTGTLPPGGRVASLTGWAFRHEPSLEPTRMQSFRMREFVRVGSTDEVVEWRDMWLKRSVSLLQDLLLPVTTEVASDPFFGRIGRLLASDQKERQLKFELLVPVISATNPTAVCSCNFHEQHFGHTFEIHTHDGQIANSACLAFGLERTTMALFKTHGLDVKDWPAVVRERLALSL